jgi:hypothetical protein
MPNTQQPASHHVMPILEITAVAAMLGGMTLMVLKLVQSMLAIVPRW